MSTGTLDQAQGQFAPGASFAPIGVDLSGQAQHRIAERLAQLTSLVAGWDGADAQAIDRAAVTTAATVLAQVTPAGLPEPELFPVPDGGIQIEWRAGPVEIELEIEPHGQAAVFVCDDEQAGQKIDGELPADLSRFALALARLNAYV